MSSEIKLRLKNELKKLQSMFNRGLGLSLVYLPGQIRHGENGGLLSGEVQNGIILIYESREDIAVETLAHEFVEACFIVPLVKDFYTVMQHMRKTLLEKDEVIHKLLMGKKEDTVNGLSIPITKLMETA